MKRSLRLTIPGEKITESWTDLVVPFPMGMIPQAMWDKFVSAGEVFCVYAEIGGVRIPVDGPVDFYGHSDESPPDDIMFIRIPSVTASVAKTIDIVLDQDLDGQWGDSFPAGVYGRNAAWAGYWGVWRATAPHTSIQTDRTGSGKNLTPNWRASNDSGTISNEGPLGSSYHPSAPGAASSGGWRYEFEEPFEGFTEGWTIMTTVRGNVLDTPSLTSAWILFEDMANNTHKFFLGRDRLTPPGHERLSGYIRNNNPNNTGALLADSEDGRFDPEMWHRVSISNDLTTVDMTSSVEGSFFSPASVNSVDYQNGIGWTMEGATRLRVGGFTATESGVLPSLSFAHMADIVIVPYAWSPARIALDQEAWISPGTLWEVEEIQPSTGAALLLAQQQRIMMGAW